MPRSTRSLARLSSASTQLRLLWAGTSFTCIEPRRGRSSFPEPHPFSGEAPPSPDPIDPPLWPSLPRRGREQTPGRARARIARRRHRPLGAHALWSSRPSRARAWSPSASRLLADRRTARRLRRWRGVCVRRPLPRPIFTRERDSGACLTRSRSATYPPKSLETSSSSVPRASVASAASRPRSASRCASARSASSRGRRSTRSSGGLDGRLAGRRPASGPVQELRGGPAAREHAARLAPKYVGQSRDALLGGGAVGRFHGPTTAWASWARLVGHKRYQKCCALETVDLGQSGFSAFPTSSATSRLAVFHNSSNRVLSSPANLGSQMNTVAK